MVRPHNALQQAALMVAIAVGLCAARLDVRADQRAGTDIAALVNGEPVTRAEVARLLASPVERRQLLQEPGAANAEGKDLNRLALQTLIRRRLILQEAARRQFTIAADDVDRAVTSLRRRFDDLESLGTWMREQGLDERSLFETIRMELLAARVRAALSQDVRVPDDVAARYYDLHKDDLKRDEVRLQIIVVKDETAAREILRTLREGANFAALAQQHSVGRRASQGGDTGWVDVETLGPALRGAVGDMTTRQARGPLPLGDAFLIVRLGGRRTGRTKTLAEARPEIERRLLPTRQREVVEAWLADQEKKSTIEFPDAD